MRISDWNSDVCSSDLQRPQVAAARLGDAAFPLKQRPVAAQAEHLVAERRYFRGTEQFGKEQEAVAPVVFELLPRQRSIRLLQAAIDDGVQARQPARMRGGARRVGVVGSCHLLRSEEHTSELQSLMRISYAVFCLKKKKK